MLPTSGSGGSLKMNRRDMKRLTETLRAETGRAMTELHIPGHPRPYFLSQLLRDDEEWRVEGKFGALTDEAHERRRSGLVDVRVGSYRNDQVRSGALRDNSTEVESYTMVPLPIGGHLDGVRHGLWRLTESKYREAIDDMLHKKAIELSYLDENSRLPSFGRQKPMVDMSFCDLATPDTEAKRDLVLKASASFKKYPLLRDGSVKWSAGTSVRVFVSSEGTVVSECQSFRTLSLDLWYLSKDGHGLSKSHTWYVTDPEEIPDLTTIRRTIKGLYGQLDALAKAPVLRSFSGPVLLDPRPAGMLVHEALGHRLEGNRLLSSGEGQTFRDALGEQILPPGVSLRDDPRLSHFGGKSLVGHYNYDDEGVPSQCADLVVDGTLRGFLSSRIPIAKRHRSNGHGRSAYNSRAISRMGVTMLEAHDGLSDDELFAAFLEEIRCQHVPYGIRIMEASGGETSTDSYDFQAFLGQIDCAAKVYPDGRQELVRGVDFVGTPLNAIRGIVGVGRRMEVDNAWCGAESGYVPVTTISPAVLVDELELQQKPGRTLTQFAYPMPWETPG